MWQDQRKKRSYGITIKLCSVSQIWNMKSFLLIRKIQIMEKHSVILCSSTTNTRANQSWMKVAGKFQTQKAFLRTAVEDAAASARILEEFQKVDLQQCVKAQQSQAYAQRVKLSNLQQMTKTVAYVQEHGYDTQDDLQSDFLEAQSQTAEIRKALRSTEQKLKEVSEQIRYTGQRLSFMRLPLTLSSILPLLALHFPVTS